jgi:hypothetical protein
VERPLVDTLDALIRHEQAALTGDANATEAAAVRVDTSLAAFATAVEAHGGGLALDREGLARRGREHVLPQTLQTEWRALRAAGPGATVDHAHLIADLRMLVQHVGDLSNLILDPDLDSYYLMDVTLLALPQTLDRVAKSLASARAATADGTIDPAERAALQVHAAMFQEADRLRIEASTTTAMQEDANFNGRRPSLAPALKPAVAAWVEANAAWESRLLALAGGETKADEASTTEAALACVQTGAALFRIAVTELDGLLETRVAALRGEQTADIAWTMLALAAALARVWRISRSITRPLDVIVAALSESADDVSRASALLSHGSASLAHEAHEASASLEQASSALEEISATTASSAENARRAAETGPRPRLSRRHASSAAETPAAVTACATGVHAIGDAARLIMLGDADVMVAGGAEAAVNPLGIAGFCAARALSTGFNETPSRGSRPWDKDRDGFVMGEGAGVVVLEEYEHAKKRGAKIYAEVGGYGMSGDAYHITAPAEGHDGAFRAMKAALKNGGVMPEQIQYVNAHGTSTPLGDDLELEAVERFFGDSAKGLAMSSTKSATGHLLGAAGAIEAIFSILAIRDNVAPPTLNLDEPSRESVIDRVAKQAQQRRIDVALSNSFGFGGTNASIIFKRAA